MLARAWRAAAKAAAQLAAGPSWWWKNASTASPMNFSTSPPCGRDRRHQLVEIEVEPVQHLLRRQPVRQHGEVAQVAQQQRRLQRLDVAAPDMAFQDAPAGERADIGVEQRRLGQPQQADLAGAAQGRDDALQQGAAVRPEALRPPRGEDRGAGRALAHHQRHHLRHRQAAAVEEVQLLQPGDLLRRRQAQPAPRPRWPAGSGCRRRRAGARSSSRGRAAPPARPRLQAKVRARICGCSVRRCRLSRSTGRPSARSRRPSPASSSGPAASWHSSPDSHSISSATPVGAGVVIMRSA